MSENIQGLKGKSGIYLIRSPIGMCYIGQSTNLYNRYNAYRLLKCKSQCLIYKSIIKYGFENHYFFVLKYCNFLDLNMNERFYQKINNTIHPNGLNAKFCSLTEKSGVCSEAAKIKISNSLKGIKRPAHVIESLRKFNTGKKMSDETKRKLSNSSRKANLGKVLSFKTKDLISQNNGMKKRVINIETGIFYFSIKEASIYENINYQKLRASLGYNNKTKIRYV